MSAIHGSAALYRIAEAIAVSASEEPAGTVELCYLSAAIDAIGADVAHEPGAFAAKSARGPSDRHALLDLLPLTAVLPEVVEQCDSPHRRFHLPPLLTAKAANLANPRSAHSTL
jgi:hypothetical protein